VPAAWSADRNGGDDWGRHWRCNDFRHRWNKRTWHWRCGRTRHWRFNPARLRIVEKYPPATPYDFDRSTSSSYLPGVALESIWTRGWKCGPSSNMHPSSSLARRLTGAPTRPRWSGTGCRSSRRVCASYVRPARWQAIRPPRPVPALALRWGPQIVHHGAACIALRGPGSADAGEHDSSCARANERPPDLLPSVGFTKGPMLDYYRAIASVMPPHVDAGFCVRPLSRPGSGPEI
jgi:hypothetical protein